MFMDWFTKYYLAICLGGTFVGLIVLLLLLFFPEGYFSGSRKRATKPSANQEELFAIYKKTGSRKCWEFQGKTYISEALAEKAAESSGILNNEDITCFDLKYKDGKITWKASNSFPPAVTFPSDTNDVKGTNPEQKRGPRGGRYTEDKTKDGRPYRRYF